MERYTHGRPTAEWHAETAEERRQERAARRDRLMEQAGRRIVLAAACGALAATLLWRVLGWL